MPTSVTSMSPVPPQALPPNTIQTGGLSKPGAGFTGPASFPNAAQPSKSRGLLGATAATLNNAVNSSPGTYKGVTITPGSDESVAAQVASIDAGTHPSQTAQPAAQPVGTQQTQPLASAQTNTQTSTAAATPTFPGLLGGITKAAVAGTTAAQPYIGQTAQYGAGNVPVGQQAEGTANQYAQDIENAVAPYTRLASGQATTGTEPVAQGQELATIGAANALGTNIANAGNLALTGTSQALTGQEQAATAANEAAGQTLAGTSQGLSGATSAAQLAQPSGTFPFVFNPATGSFTVSGGNLQGAIQNGVQQAVSNPALYTSLYNAIQSTYGAASAGMFQQAYIQAGGNPQTAAAVGSGAASVAEAPYSAQSQKIQTAETAESQALNQIYGSSAAATYTLNTALNNIQSLGSLTLQTAQGGTINPLSTQVGNQTIAQFRNSLGSASQAQFNSNMANFQSALSAIYADGSGGTPTQVSTWSTAIANGSMPMQQLQSIYNAAVSEGNLRLSNARSATGSAYSGVQSAAGGGAGGGSSADPLGILG